MTEVALRFETLIAAHHDEIHAYMWRLLRNAGWADAEVEAEDLVQDVFLRAYRAFPRLRADSNVRAWLYKIATNCTYTALRRDGRRPVDSLPQEDAVSLAAPDAGPEQQVVGREALARVRRSIAALPDKQRAALVLRYVQELDYASIAEALACSQDSARANVYQALRRLRKVFGVEDE